jgi:hypothetical protein
MIGVESRAFIIQGSAICLYSSSVQNVEYFGISSRL